MTVLDRELDGDAESFLRFYHSRKLVIHHTISLSSAVAYPVTSRLRDIFSDLLGRKTERTNLGGQRRGGTNLTTGSQEVAVLIWSAFAILRDNAGLLRRRGLCAAYMTLISLGSILGAVKSEEKQVSNSD